MLSENVHVVDIEMEHKNGSSISAGNSTATAIENSNLSFLQKYKKSLLIISIISLLIIVLVVVLCVVLMLDDVHAVFGHSHDVIHKFSQSTNANTTGNINSEKIIWHVWGGNEKDLNSFAMGSLTLTLSKRAEQYGFKVIVVTKDNLWNYLTPLDLPNNFDDIDTAAHKSDVIRVSLLNKYGGIYMDIGTLLLNPEIVEEWWNKMHENATCRAFSMYLYHPTKSDLSYKAQKGVANEDVQNEYQFAITGGCKGSLFMKAMQYFNVETMYHRKTTPTFYHGWRGKYLCLGDVTAFEIVQRNKDYFYPHQYHSENPYLFTVNAMGATEVYQTDQTIYNKIKNLKKYVGKNPYFLIPQPKKNKENVAPDLIKFTSIGSYRSVSMDAIKDALQDILEL